MVSLTGNLPKYLIKSHLSTELLGFFTGISTTTIGMSLVVVSLIASALRRLAVYYSSNISGFISLFMKLIIIAICFGMINIAFVFIAGKYFLAICFDETYIEYLPAMRIYAVAGIFLSLVSILGDTIISTQHYWWRVFASIASILAMYLAGYFMLPEYGLNGVAVVCVIGFGVELLFCVLGLSVLYKKQKINHLLKTTMMDNENVLEIV
jgi:O-antigen/teichoic acid export membrane protein